MRVLEGSVEEKECVVLAKATARAKLKAGIETIAYQEYVAPVSFLPPLKSDAITAKTPLLKKQEDKSSMCPQLSCVIL